MTPEPGAAISPEARERDLRGTIQELERRLEAQAQAHAEELRRTEAEVIEAMTRRVEEAVSAFGSMVRDFHAQREDLLKSAEEAVVRLAVTLARRIVGDAIQIDDEVVLETVRSALGHVQEKEAVVVRVNPRDLKIVREHGSEWLSIVEGTGSLEIVEDERVRPGGCLVETEAGNVEAQIEKQIQTLEKALVERVR